MSTDATPTGSNLDDIVEDSWVPDREALVAADLDLRHAMASVRAALGEYRTTEHAAWAAYARHVDTALIHLEAELNVSVAQLAVLQAESADQLSRTLSHAKTSWVGLNDDLKLQTHLAELEAKDLLHRVGHDLDAARKEASKVIDKIRGLLR